MYFLFGKVHIEYRLKHSIMVDCGEENPSVKIEIYNNIPDKVMISDFFFFCSFCTKTCPVVIDWNCLTCLICFSAIIYYNLFMSLPGSKSLFVM